MDHYLDIRLLPDPEFPAPLLMNALFTKLHRALVSHLVYGVLRWRSRLDAFLARASARPLAKVRPRPRPLPHQRDCHQRQQQ